MQWTSVTAELKDKPLLTHNSERRGRGLSQGLLWGPVRLPPQCPTVLCIAPTICKAHRSQQSRLRTASTPLVTTPSETLSDANRAAQSLPAPTELGFALCTAYPSSQPGQGNHAPSAVHRWASYTRYSTGSILRYIQLQTVTSLTAQEPRPCFRSKSWAYLPTAPTPEVQPGCAPTPPQGLHAPGPAPREPRTNGTGLHPLPVNRKINK